ncbi:YqaJ viral recombinase family protein [Bacillus songklensis]|uniref:YqaJ viral recombinase family protein n=1 Tax=Bacillus songklensis TaxID=1069116 RepID=A0ABV8B3Q5_9BACI
MQASIFTSTAEMSREEWLEARTKGIGGSDASVILGLNKWKTPFELWLEKTGQFISEDIQSEAAYWGNQMEDVVAKEFSLRTNKKVRRCNRILQHPEYTFMLANIDREVVGEKAVLECKTASEFKKKEWEGDEVPGPYLVQVQHYLAVTGYQQGYIAVLMGGNKFEWKPVNRDEELIQYIIEQEKHFWEYHVMQNIPPAIDGSSAAEQFLKERYKETNPEKTMELNADFKSKIEEYNSLKTTISQLEQQKKALENEMKNELKDAEVGFANGYEVLWKPRASSRVDSKALKEKFPDVYQQVVKQSVSRYFSIKQLD